MRETTMDDGRLGIHPVTPERWPDLEALFGPQGACGGCWCMWWRLKRSEFTAQCGEGNRLALKQIVDSGQAPGLLAYVEGAPAGWVSAAPRQNYPVLDRSPHLKPVDDTPVWSVVCFYIAPAYRRQGLSVRLLQAAVEYARAHGVRVVEGYPVLEGKGRGDMSIFTGVASTFAAAGFQQVAYRGGRRAVWRLELPPL
jgi:GNAT superfamily N-acetyltransferase